VDEENGRERVRKRDKGIVSGRKSNKEDVFRILHAAVSGVVVA
jgi:hypothetical protein